jgi:hypothetical protein
LFAAVAILCSQKLGLFRIGHATAWVLWDRRLWDRRLWDRRLWDRRLKRGVKAKKLEVSTTNNLHLHWGCDNGSLR